MTIDVKFDRATLRGALPVDTNNDIVWGALCCIRIAFRVQHAFSFLFIGFNKDILKTNHFLQWKLTRKLTALGSLGRPDIIDYTTQLTGDAWDCANVFDADGKLREKHV